MSNSDGAVLAVLDTIIAGDKGDTQVTSETIVLDAAADTAKKDPDFIHMPLTADLLAAARKAADGQSLGPWLQEYLAAQLGVTLPVKTDKRVKYTGPNAEQDRAAARERSITKAGDLRKALMAMHKARKAGDKAEIERLDAKIAEIESR